MKIEMAGTSVPKKGRGHRARWPAAASPALVERANRTARPHRVRDGLLRMMHRMGIAICVAGSSLAHAAVVYDGGTPDQVNAYTGSVGDVPMEVATKATLASGITFNEMKWWGVPYPTYWAPFANSHPQRMDDDFTLTIYSVGVSGGPGTVVGGPISLGSGARVATGTLFFGETEYLYSASFAPITLAAGDYFFALTNAFNPRDPAGTTWGWETTGKTGLASVIYSYSQSNQRWELNGTTFSPNLAFNLAYTGGGGGGEVPEPGSLALFALGALGLTAVRRRRPRH